MREIITIHIGQTGVQIADPYWRLMCSEHNIDIDGNLLPSPPTIIKSCRELMSSKSHLKNDIDEGQFHTVFQETPKGKYCSRAILIDPDPDTISTFKRYCDHGLYSKARYVTSYDSCSNLFIKGFSNHYTFIRPKICEIIRHLLEEADSPEGFLAICSLGGGTGSGLSVALLNLMQNRYKKLAQIQLTVHPTPKATILEPYNCGLHEYVMSDYNRGVLLIDNEALNRAMQLMRTNVQGFETINGLIAQVASSLTVGTRFQEFTQGGVGLREMEFVLNPTKKIRYSSVSYCPIISNLVSKYDKLNEIQLTRDCFTSNNQLLNCKQLASSPNISTCMIFRGDLDYFKTRKQVYDCLRRAPKGILPIGFNMCISEKGPNVLLDSGITKVKNSACRVSCNLGLSNLWKTTYKNFKTLFSKRAFVHWYVTEGMPISYFDDSLQSLLNLNDDYNLMLGKYVNFVIFCSYY